MQIFENLFLFSFLFHLCFVPSIAVDDHDEAGDFCYTEEECGPDSEKWGGDCKDGVSQSPIDIIRRPGQIATYVHLDFNDGYASEDYWIRNNGHTVQVNLQEQPTSSGEMTGYGFDRPYIFAQIHFHWGINDSTGSEHTINGVHYPLEVHLVHYDSQYENFSAAAQSGDPKGLAVLGLFLAPGTEEDVNESFDTISANLPFFYQPEESQIPISLDLHWMLPDHRETFFRYMGSLTTPNCTQVVEWTVIEEPIHVKPSEIERFRRVLNHEERPMGFNNRPIQPVGNRLVEYLVRMTDN